MSSGSRCEASRKFFMQRALEAMMPIEIWEWDYGERRTVLKPQKGLPHRLFGGRRPEIAWTNYAPLDTVSSRLTASISLMRFS